MATPTQTPPPNWMVCTAKIEFAGFYLGEPMLIPSCLLALFLGVYFWSKIRALKSFEGHITYSTTFLGFGIMMTSACFVHCIFAYDYLHPPVPIHAMIASILDVGLTSCVGLSWSFNALVDVGLVHESWRLYLVMAASFISLIAAWTVQLTKVGGPSPLMFGGLYFGPILISGILYSACQVWRFRRGETQGWKWFVAAEVFAFMGVSCAGTFPQLAEFLCTYLGPNLSPWFNADFWWFLLSNASMYSFAQFYLARTTEKVDQRGYSFHLQPMA